MGKPVSFARLRRAGDRAVDRLWVQHRAPVVKAIRRQMARVAPLEAMDWQAVHLAEIDRRKAKGAPPKPVKVRGQGKKKPTQPPAPKARYSISDVDTLARVMRWDARQTDAARRYRQAVDIIGSAGSGSLDLDRVSGGGTNGAAPAQRYAEAAEFLAAVHNGRPERSVRGATLGPVAPILSSYEGDILRRMIGQGMTSREIAASFFQSTADKWREEVTSTVRLALTRIADWTLPPPRSRGIRGWTSPEGEDA